MANASDLRCPICQGGLLPVGNRGKRVKCPKCRNVYDKGQLSDFYGLESVSETGAFAHDYETAHMHATEKGHANRPDAVPKKMTTSKQVSAPSQSPISPGSAVQAAVQQFRDYEGEPVRDDGSFMIRGEGHASSQPAPQQKPVSSGSSAGMRFFVVVFVIVMLASLLPVLMVGFLEMSDGFSDGDGGSGNGGAGDVPALYGETASSAGVLDDYLVGLDDADVVGNYDGREILFVELSWLNTSDEDLWFAGLGFMTAAQGGKELERTYYISSKQDFAFDSEYDSVEPDELGKVQMAFALPDDFDADEPVKLRFRAYGGAETVDAETLMIGGEAGGRHVTRNISDAGSRERAIVPEPYPDKAGESGEPVPYGTYSVSSK